MTDDAPLAQLLTRLARLEERVARAEERVAVLEEALARATVRGADTAPGNSTVRANQGRQRRLSRPSSRAGFLAAMGLGAAGLAAAEAVALTAFDRSGTGESGLPVYNVRAYGAMGDGLTDDTDAINRAIADAARAGGGIVGVPAGTYRVAPRPHPLDAAYGACLLMRGGVTLRGAGLGATTIRLTDHAPLPEGSTHIYLLLNATINPALAAASPDQRMAVEDIAFDGNARHQDALAHGLVWIRCRDVSHNCVRVANVHGTAGSGPAETFCFEFQLGAGASYAACEAAATDGGATASGFSADGATDLTYVSCLAHGMAVGQGFTHYGCALLRYAVCHAYQNRGYGFNSEVSEDVRYAACVSGGRADGSGQGAYAPHQSLGNEAGGFFVRGSAAVDLVGCSSRYNDGHGLWIAHRADGVRVCGGDYSANGGWGIAAEAESTGVAISHETRLADNAAGALRARTNVNAASPFLYDSGWVRAAGTIVSAEHGLPGRPRVVTVYGGAPTVPDETEDIPLHAGPVLASNARVRATDASPGQYYRLVAMY